MKYYTNLNGTSNVLGYEIYDQLIRVYFNGGDCYEYTVASAGIVNIEQMKRLAIRGSGLNKFINTSVKKRYSRKL